MAPAIIALNLWITILCFTKGKPWMGIIGFFVPLVHIIGACRLAKPTSRYARKNYGNVQMAEAEARFGIRRPDGWTAVPDLLDEPAERNGQDSNEWADMTDDELREAAMDPIARRSMKLVRVERGIKV